MPVPSISKVMKAFIDSHAEVRPDEARMRLRELYGDVADLEDENRELRERVSELQAELERRKDMEYKDGGYFVIVNGEGVGPICPECYRNKGLVYPLESTSQGARCPTCGRYYAGAQAAVEGPRRGSVIV